MVTRSDHKFVIIAELPLEMDLVARGDRHLKHLKIQIHCVVELRAQVIHLHPVGLIADLGDIFGLKIVIPSALFLKLPVCISPGIHFAHERHDKVRGLSEFRRLLRIIAFRGPVQDLGLLPVSLDPLHLLRPEFPVPDNIVQRENIQEDSLVEGHVLVDLLDENAGGHAVSELRMPPEIALVRVKSLKEIGLFKLIRMGAQKIVLIPQHHDIDVIVPGDHPFVPLSAEDSSRGGVVFDPVFPADPVELGEKIQLHCPYSLHLGGDHIAAPLFLLKKGVLYFKFRIGKYHNILHIGQIPVNPHNQHIISIQYTTKTYRKKADMRKRRHKWLLRSKKSCCSLRFRRQLQQLLHSL